MNKCTILALIGSIFAVVITENTFDGRELEVFDMFQKDISTKLPAIIYEYNVDEIMIIGQNSDYTDGIKNQIESIFNNEINVFTVGVEND